MNDLRNKVFLAVTCGFLVIMMLVAPALKIFDNLGIISTEKMGNIIEPQGLRRRYAAFRAV